jgi:hypothetical protein
MRHVAEELRRRRVLQTPPPNGSMPAVGDRQHVFDHRQRLLALSERISAPAARSSYGE